ncbi:MAG: type II toxin-antitoxin system PemK/MazF family toxin [Candidatus Peribacteraceae bacterium]|nr:type II toxin-antitoxin system PemK/MazF family toxin [Candidatus Peribacteraceae bacterium]
MAKAFDAWNIVKKRIDSKNIGTEVFFHEREVWWCSVGLNIGVESDGKNAHFERPVLIFRKFNGHMLWVVPLTSKQHEGVHFYRISHDRGASFACLSQLKTISSKRLLRKIGMIAENEFDHVRVRIAGYIKNRAPR